MAAHHLTIDGLPRFTPIDEVLPKEKVTERRWDSENAERDGLTMTIRRKTETKKCRGLQGPGESRQSDEGSFSGSKSGFQKDKESQGLRNFSCPVPASY